MLSEAVAVNPAEKVEDRPPTSGSQKSAAGSKIYKSRIPTSQAGRSDSTSRTPHEECSSEISPSNSARRLAMKTINVPSTGRKPVTNPVSASEKRQLEVQYNSKRTRYASLKKDLVHKQEVIQEMREEMSKLREKIIAIGGRDPGDVEAALKPAQTECPKQRSASVEPSPDDRQQRPICADESAVIGVALMENQLRSLCDRSQEICQGALDRGLSLAALVKSWLTESSREEKPRVDDDTPMYCALEHSKLEAQLAILGQDNEETRTRLDELRTAQSDFVAEFARRSACLRGEYDNCRAKRGRTPSAVECAGLQEQLNAALDELRAERDKVNQAKEGTRMIERQLQKMQAKLRDTETYVTSMEATQQQLQNNVRALQAQLKQKDHTMETKMKEMHKALKSSESLVVKMEKQRDGFEARIVELKEKMTSKEAEARAIIKELSEKYEAIVAEINEEREKRQQAENSLSEMEERCRHLEEKMLRDLASEKSNNLAVADNAHTENEVGLYKDLEATRAELEKHKEMIKQLEHEKQEIVAVMRQAANHDNEVETKNKLAAELVAKTSDLQNLMLEHARLQKITKFTQERNEMLENQLSEIQRRLHAKSKENGKSEIDASELQQQIRDLRDNLAEVMQQNQELENTLTQKQLELEQRDRVMREQSKFLKARDELLSLLRGRQQASTDAANENYEDIDEINKQIAAKTEAIQELYATLESKQMQVMRLEKLVKLLEDQQDRAQAQRTRLEHRIAQLEVSLREKNGNGSNGSRAFDILKKKAL